MEIRAKGYPLFRKKFYFGENLFKYTSPDNFYKPNRMLAKWQWWAWKRILDSGMSGLLPDEAIDVPEELYHDFFMRSKKGVWMLGRGPSGFRDKFFGLFWLDGRPCFLKYTQGAGMAQFVKQDNEAMLDGRLEGFVPRIIESRVDDHRAYYLTEFMCGSRPVEHVLDERVMGILIRMGGLDLAYDDRLGAYRSMAHGDFCPWNIHAYEGRLVVVDWEFKDMKPLGHDLFTFLIQSNLLIGRQRMIIDILEEHEADIRYYFNVFGVRHWKPYLQLYLQDRCNSPVLARMLQEKHRLVCDMVREMDLGTEGRVRFRTVRQQNKRSQKA